MALVVAMLLTKSLELLVTVPLEYWMFGIIYLPQNSSETDSKRCRVLSSVLRDVASSRQPIGCKSREIKILV